MTTQQVKAEVKKLQRLKKSSERASIKHEKNIALLHLKIEAIETKIEEIREQAKRDSLAYTKARTALVHKLNPTQLFEIEEQL